MIFDKKMVYLYINNIYSYVISPAIHRGIAFEIKMPVNYDSDTLWLLANLGST